MPSHTETDVLTVVVIHQLVVWSLTVQWTCHGHEVRTTKDSQSLEILIVCAVSDLDLHHWRGLCLCVCAPKVSPAMP